MGGRRTVREVVETLDVAGGGFKVDIVKRADGLFQVFPQKWVEEVVPGHGKVAEFWEDVGTTASIASDLDTARSIARELLATQRP